MRVSVGKGREENERKVLHERVKPSRRRLLAQQTVVGAVLGCGKKVVACGSCHKAQPASVRVISSIFCM